MVLWAGRLAGHVFGIRDHLGHDLALALGVGVIAAVVALGFDRSRLFSAGWGDMSEMDSGVS